MFEVLQKRRSIRKYLNKPVADEKIKMVLEAARLGPSAANRQPCHVVVVTKLEVKELFGNVYKPDWFVEAPVIIAVCADTKQAWRRSDGEEFWKADAAICMQNIVLVAAGLGLGTCWIAAFDEKAAAKALGVPKGIRVVALTPLGYPAEEKGPVTERKPIEEIAHFNKW